MPYSDYIVYVDESGDHELNKVDPAYPVFVLAFCIFEKGSYVDQSVPTMQRLKFRWFGHDAVVFHEREIRKQLVPFKFLQSQPVRDRFMADLDEAMATMPFTVIASVIDKFRLRAKYAVPGHPYEMALQFCLERLHRFLEDKGQTDRITNCVFERRGAAEDVSLELEFRRVCGGANYAGKRMTCFDIQFMDKRSNSTGLQIADLVARPIGLSVVKKGQPNRAFDLLAPKLRRSNAGVVSGFGLKTFP